MKKISLMLFAALLLPAGLFAESPSAHLSARGGEFFAQKVLLASKQATKEEIQKVAAKQAQKADASLRALEKAYPEQAKLISSLADIHAFIVKEAVKGDQDERYVYETLTRQLEYLYEGFIDLEKASPEAFAQAKVIINHDYTVIAAGDFLMTLKKMSSEIVKLFPTVKIKGYDWFQSLS